MEEEVASSVFHNLHHFPHHHTFCLPDRGFTQVNLKSISFVYIYVNFRGSNVLFSRITMGFIINLTIALILFTVEAMKNLEIDERETTNCEAKAYLTLYFFLVSPTKGKSDA